VRKVTRTWGTSATGKWDGSVFRQKWGSVVRCLRLRQRHTTREFLAGKTSCSLASHSPFPSNEFAFHHYHCRRICEHTFSVKEHSHFAVWNAGADQDESNKKRRTMASSSTTQSSVSSLLAELYELSPNKDLFEKLRDGTIDTLSVVAAAAAPEQEHKEDVPAVVADHDGDDNDASQRRRVKVWSQTRDHLLVLLQRDDPTGLVQFIADSANDQVMIYGECILALTATSSNPTNEDDANVSAELPRQRRLQQRAHLREVLRPFGTVRANGYDTYRAKREWMCILLHELSSELTAAENLEWQYARASWTDACRPGLIGHSFFQLGVAAGKAGDVAKETHCYQMVVMDLHNNLMYAQLSNNLRFEVWGIIYWHRRACEALMEMDPALHGEGYQSYLDKVEEKYPGVAFQPPSPAMIGPIALTYLSPTEYRKKLLREICATDCSDEALAPVCFRFDYCHEIDDLLFAVERHRMVLPILSGVVHLSYEPHIQETLDALKSLDAEVSVAWKPR
jgi:hypothetical protein